MNISEFARRAGVSKAAVSRYFNDGYLSREKRESIEKAILETGYKPSRAARSVKTRITKLIGVIIPKLSSDSCSRITEGISKVLNENGYEMLLVNTANDHKKEVAYLDLFRKQKMDGIILLGSIFTPLHFSILSKTDIPVVISGQKLNGFSSVYFDDFGAAYAVTEHMIQHGAKRVAVIGANQNDKAAGAERMRGFLKAISDNSLEFDPRLKAISEFSMDSGYERAKKLFIQKPFPDAVFCATDTIAAGAVLYMNERGMKLPDDIMVGSVGDSKISRVLSLTTAHLHYRDAGIESARILMDAIHTDEHSPKSLKLGYELVIRNSTVK